MTRGKILLLIIVGFGLIWVALVVFSVRHVIAMSDLANRDVAPHLPGVSRQVATADAPPPAPYPGQLIVRTLQQQWETDGTAPNYPKIVLAEDPNKGKQDDESARPWRP